MGKLARTVFLRNLDLKALKKLNEFKAKAKEEMKKVKKEANKEVAKAKEEETNHKQLRIANNENIKILPDLENGLRKIGLQYYAPAIEA